MKLIAWIPLATVGLIITACGGGGGSASPDFAHTTSPSSRVVGRIGEVDVFPANSAPVSDIEITLANDRREVTAVTDESGEFDFIDAPSGDLLFTFVTSACTIAFPVPAVVDGSTVRLDLIGLSCGETENEASVLSDYEESLTAIIRSIDPNERGQIPICVPSGGEFITRLMESPLLFGAPVEVEAGDRVSVVGFRDWSNASGPDGTEIDIGEVEVIGSGLADPCQGQPIPEPT